MTLKLHTAAQIIATILQILNVVSGVVPLKYQPYVMCAITILQAVMALVNHSYNPDGTPATVAYVAKLLLLMLLFSGVAQAQTPASSTQHFSLSGSAVSFMGPGGTAPASIADGYFNATKNFSIGYQQITIPQLATVKLGVVDYGKPACSWLGAKLSAKLVFDCSKVQIDVFGGAGKLNESTLNVNRVAETLGACISYTLGANVSAKLVCGQWLHGGIVNGFITNGSLPGTAPAAPNNSSAAVSSGLKVHF